MSNCNIELDIAKLPKIIQKIEFFIFRAIEKKNIDIYSLLGKDRNEIVKNLLLAVKNEIIPEYINTYKQKAAEYSTNPEFEYEQSVYEDYVINLTQMLSLWDKIVPNFIYYSSVFSVANKLSVSEDGLVSVEDVADEEQRIAKMMDFDAAANEIDPLDAVDKGIELYLRSLTDPEVADEYTDVSSVNYSKLVQTLFNDLKDSVGLQEIIDKLNKKAVDVPIYKNIVDRLYLNTMDPKFDTNFRIAFQNTFSKAFMPIYMVSIESTEALGDVPSIKVMNATKAKESFYENKIQSNFLLRGMEIGTNFNEKGEAKEKINFATNNNGVWELDVTSIQKIRDYIEKSPASELKYRQLELLKGLGFVFSPKTIEFLLSSYEHTGKGARDFRYIYNHLLALIKDRKTLSTPYSDIKRLTVRANEKTDTKYSASQSNTLLKYVEAEFKYSSEYNVDHSVLNAEGNRQHSIQMHNNITNITKILSDADKYPTLQDILEKEASCFWMDPETNISIRNSYFMNSLFYFDPADPNYGKRRIVYTSDGNISYNGEGKNEKLKIEVVNTGGLQSKVEKKYTEEDPTVEAGSVERKTTEKDSSVTTGLSDIEKIFQDINSFMKKGYNSFMRLSDKSTDLGIMMNYYHDPVTGRPVRRPLESVAGVANTMYNTEQFRNYVKNLVRDVASVKLLNKYGFLKDLKTSSKAVVNSYGYVDKILSQSSKAAINKLIEESSDPDQITFDSELDEMLNNDIEQYFSTYIESFLNKIKPVTDITPHVNLIDVKTEATKVGLPLDLKAVISYYLLNSFIMDVEQMKLYFGDVLYFKDFHKRSSKDSATGIFTTTDPMILSELNNHTGGPSSYGRNTNLQRKQFINQLLNTNQITIEQAQTLFAENSIDNSFKSAVVKDVDFVSDQPQIIDENVQRIIATNDSYISQEMRNLYENSLKDVIKNKYNGTEADGQGKCTFDFYRTISILTKQWSVEQEEQYEKIVMYDYYDRLIDDLSNDPEGNKERINSLIASRDALKYDPLAPVYFPPKKFQYSGPMDYKKIINGKEYTENVPIFDKFSVAPLIPTITKNKPDDELMKRMVYNNVGYLKYESGSKAETPIQRDELYENFDSNKPSERTVKPFIVGEGFVSQHNLFFNHLKEQVTIDSHIHDSTIFGSQIRKLIMMDIEHPDLKNNAERYNQLISDTVELEKNLLFTKMGIKKEGNILKVDDFKKLVDYFIKEIDRKNQNINVKKALSYNEKTNQFNIPLDSAVQAQIIEGIIISAINNNIVRYKTNGSMLIQVAITGNEAMKFNKEDSARALDSVGNKDLAFYNVETKDGKAVVKEMEVKIALTGQWLKLLELTHPDKFPIRTLDRLNEALKNTEWRNTNKKAIRMVAYRIPTQGMNFLDVMVVKEFLPAAFGDAIIMPSEVVIKSGSDFDIDKMFVFYPNLDRDGKYVNFNYDKKLLNTNIEKEKQTVVNQLKHWKNYRAMTLPVLQEEYNKIRKDLQKGIVKETKTLEKLNDLAYNVNLILAMMEQERSIIGEQFKYVASRNEKEDSYLNLMITDQIIFNLDEYEQYKKEKKINVLNPLNWIDTKREGLLTILNGINNLQNKSLDELRNAEEYQRKEIESVREEIQTELDYIRRKLYTYSNIKGNIQNKLYDVMADSILHPSNYLKLMTPSYNYTTMPLVDDIYALLGKGVNAQGEHLKTDYKNTDILNRGINYEKFLSLLKGKSDLGIAAVANTMNVLLQLSNARASSEFLKSKKIKTFFSTSTIEKTETNNVTSIDYSSIYDEDGVLKSQFYSEFINAFVDAAKDDYVFAINAVTELSPIMFYMKYMGISTKKILYFINQPAIRDYIKQIAIYDNQFTASSENTISYTAKQKALTIVAQKLGLDVTDVDMKTGEIYTTPPNKNKIYNYLEELGLKQYNIPTDKLRSSIKNENIDISSLTQKEKNFQLMMLNEFLNLKAQSNSFTNVQSVINFDTKPFSSSYDIAARSEVYNEIKKGEHIIDVNSVNRIIQKTMISPLNAGPEIRALLSTVMPIRNNKLITDAIMKGANTISDNKLKEKFARVAKNDFITYILQNYFDSSKEGVKFLQEYFDTDKKSINEYILEIINTDKLTTTLNKIKNLPDYTSTDPQEVKETLSYRYPIIEAIVIETGTTNKKIKNFSIVKPSNNVIDVNDFITQFDKLTSLDAADEDIKMVRQFFRDLALYSIFQDGLNTTDISYMNLTPVTINNKLYGYAINEFFNKVKEKGGYSSAEADSFIKLVYKNNPDIISGVKSAKNVITGEEPKRGKWYAIDSKFVLEQPKVTVLQAKVMIVPGTKYTKQAARNKQGIYAMRPNAGDNIPGVNENFHFGNPWSHAGYEGTIKTDSIPEAVDNYEKWLKGEAFQNIQPDRRKWILDLINSGRLTGKTFLYFKSGYRSHADVLTDFINQNSIPEAQKQQAQELPEALVTTNPLLLAGVKPTDMGGNASKDIQMASESTQFIGFGTIMKEGNKSSTDKYAKAWGNLANTGNYTSNDIIMVSGSGNFGRGGVDKTEEAAAIRKTLTEKYKPLLEKAIAAGASFRIGNQYAKGNLSDQLVAEYLKKKGYKEEKLDGFSRWTLPTQASVSDVKPKGEMVKEGIYVNQGALSKEEQLELFNYLKPYLENQAAKTNKGAFASKMIGLGLRWDYKVNNQDRKAVDIPDVINPGNKDKYGYYTESITGQPLAPITSRIRKLIQKASGVDMTHYDGAIINLYDADTFISSHNDVDESKSALNYPVIGINLGGSGNFSIESRDGNPKQLDLKAGSAYIFGVGGVNRAVFHRTFAKPQDSFLPSLTTKIDGKTYESGSYRVTITMRRVMPLTETMPKTPLMTSEQTPLENQQPSDNSLEAVVTKWMNENIEFVPPWLSVENLIASYNEEKVGDQTVEEYLNTLYCSKK